MDSLPLELQEKVVSHLDLPSALALTLVCQLPSNLLHLKELLARTRLLTRREEKVLDCRMAANTGLLKKIIAFFDTINYQEDLFNDLLDKICKTFPSENQDDLLLVEVPERPEVWGVSSEALLLLVEAGSRPKIKKIKTQDLSGTLLATLNSLTRQQEEKVKELYVERVIVTRDQEGEVLGLLLSTCSSWRIGSLFLFRETGAMAWAGLASAVQAKEVSKVWCTREVLARGRRRHVRRVWRATERETWFVGEDCLSEWPDIEEIISRGDQREDSDCEIQSGQSYRESVVAGARARLCGKS